MSAQPEALRLAVWIEANVFGKGTATKNDLAAAAELRRLHEVNADLLTACEVSVYLLECFLGVRNPAAVAMRAAIAKAGGRAATPQNEVLVDALADMGRAAL